VKTNSFAKINLTLDIIGRRSDGFHELATVFQQTSLSDEIDIEPKAPDEIDVTCSIGELSGSGNICWKAAAVFKQRFGIKDGLSVHIQKKIPVGAGLSGGSGNAAALLLAMRDIFSIKCDDDELISLAAGLGSDVAFHILGGTCVGRGRGEILERLGPLPRHYAVIVFPDFSINTAKAYSTLDYEKIGRSNFTERFLKSYELSCLGNDFEFSVLRDHPVLYDIKDALGPYSLLSGSGSCVFGLFKDKSEAVKRAEELGKSHRNLFICETM
jgi:4-diphosphocytidyl-2-C-methyl-D-erythritol kinase